MVPRTRAVTSPPTQMSRPSSISSLCFDEPLADATKAVPTTVTDTVTKEAMPATTTENSNAEPESSSNEGSIEGSSTTGIILTVLAILIGLLASIFAVLVNVNPQWFQDLRNQFNI